MNQGNQKDNKNYTSLLNKSLKIFFSTAWHITLRRPSQAYFFFRTVQWQKKAAKSGRKFGEQGVNVPPIIIYSITDRCNLHCKGCYAQSLHTSTQPEMGADKMRETIREARELGVSFMVLAGGEPLVRREILDIIGDFTDVIFFVFTNGTLINEELADRMKQMRNLVPIISLEGNRAETDLRRGSGVFQSLVRGYRENAEAGHFLRHFHYADEYQFQYRDRSAALSGTCTKSGCRLFFFVEYTPIDSSTEAWEVTEEQRKIMADIVAVFPLTVPRPVH